MQRRRPLRILLTGINFPPELTSTGRYTGTLVEHITNDGCSVRVVTAPPYYPEWKLQETYSAHRYGFEERQGAKVFRCPLWVPRHPTTLKRLLHLISFALSSLPIMMAQVSWKPDLVLCVVPTLFSAPAALLAARLSGARSWLHIQDFELDAAVGFDMLPGGALISWIARSFERFLVGRFDRVSTISENMLALTAKKGVRADRAILLPNWVDTHQIRPLNRCNGLRAELGIPPERTVILYHGSMGRKQGLELLVDAAAQLSGVRGILFLLCGEGPARAELERLARKTTNVRFAGLLPEEKLNELVNMADVHVLPQRAAAADLVMPSKLTTMLASGRPVIACAAPGTQLWKVVSRVGVAVNPECAGELASAIVRLINDPTECARLGKLGREYAVEHLEKERVLGKFMVDLGQLLAEGKHAPVSMTV